MLRDDHHQSVSLANVFPRRCAYAYAACSSEKCYTPPPYTVTKTMTETMTDFSTVTKTMTDVSYVFLRVRVDY